LNKQFDLKQIQKSIRQLTDALFCAGSQKYVSCVTLSTCSHCDAALAAEAIACHMETSL